MKRIAIALAAILGLTAINAHAGRVAEGIEKYVALSNRPASIQKPSFTADGTAVLRLVDRKRIVKEDIKTGKEIETIFDVDNARETSIPDIQGFEMSEDGSKILVWRDRKPIYRRSMTAVYYIYEIRSRLLKPLSTQHTPQRAPLMSPDGRMVAFVADDNNIYLSKLDYGSEVAVTTDGCVNEVINGVPDWTYEEEFSAVCSMTWSPDNLMLAYIKYDESQVPVYHFPLYEGSCDPQKEYALYPGSFDYKYPVAGEPNSVVSIHTYDIETRKTGRVSLPGSIEYIPRISFAYSRDRLMAVTLNRAQTRMELFSINPRSLVATSVLVEQSGAWLDPLCYEEITWQPEGFVTFSSRSGYSHLYQYSYTGQLLRQLTSGDYDVTGYLGYDTKSRRHFYQSTSTGAINRVISAVDAKNVARNLTPESGYASGWLSPNGDFLTVNYSSATEVPVYTLYTTAGDKKVRVLEDNASYASRYQDAPRKEFFTFETVEGVSLNGMMIKPLDFDPSRKYPVVMYQYSGPGSQEVLNRWSCDWMNFFALRGFVVVTVDGRGTGGRGRRFMDVVYKDLGHYETIDQVAAARFVAAQPWADSRAIGIFGWSYGGYETLMALTTGDFDYACGVAVAPVTDWRYYDTVYAERYMLTPNENPDGYFRSAPLNHVEGLKCPLLIMHGTADDNVHVANAMEFVSALETSGRYCDMLLFPNMNHSIYGCNSREVVYSRMLDYFTQHLTRK